MLPHNSAPGKRLVASSAGNKRAGRGAAVMTNRCKCAYWSREYGSECYDLQEDPHEMRNLARDPARARIREHHGPLTERLLAAATPPSDMIGPEWTKEKPSASGKVSLRLGTQCCYRPKDWPDAMPPRSGRAPARRPLGSGRSRSSRPSHGIRLCFLR